MTPTNKLRTVPWRHQSDAVAFVRDLYRRGKRGAMIAAVMGTGKSAMTVYLCVEEGFQLILILCPLRVVQVWKPQFATHSNLPFLVVPLDDSFANVRAKRDQADRQIKLAKARGVPVVVVINYDSAWRPPFAPWAMKQKWDLVVADECVPAGTLIATPDGDKPIEQIGVGDKVLGFDHTVGAPFAVEVTATFRRVTRSRLIGLGPLRLTPEHPVWVEGRGYIPAGQVAETDQLRSVKSDGSVAVRMVRDTVQAREAPEVLRNELLGKMADVEAGLCGAVTDAQTQRSIPSGDVTVAPQPRIHGQSPTISAVGSEPFPRSSSPPTLSAESESKPGRFGFCHAERWQRDGAHEASTPAGEPFGLAHRICRADRGTPGLSVPLQTGHRRSGTEDRHRSGRPESPQQESSSQGPEEDAFPRIEGMDRAEIPQQGSPQRSSGRDLENPEGTTVFNLETRSSNYFAAGLLVHNCHRCKAPGGKASRFLGRLAKAARFRLGLSGTPMPHSPLDVYGYFRFIDAGIFGWSFNKFRQHYAVLGGFQNHQVVAYDNLEELNRKFYSVTYACGKDVLDLPPEMHVTHLCQLGSEARKVYRSLERDLIAEVQSGEITAANALVKLLRLQQITGGNIRTDEGNDIQIDSAKTKLLGDILEDLAPDEPVVVFCRFHKDLDAVIRVAAENHRQALELSGRADNLKRWQAGEASVLAVQIESGGVGVDLTRARYAIYFSLGFSLGSYEQSLARIHRPGQTRPVEYIHLLAEGTIDEKVMDALARRADVVNNVLAQMKGPA